MKIIQSAAELAVVSGGEIECTIGLDGISCTGVVEEVIDWFIDTYNSWDNFGWDFDNWWY